MNIIKAYELLIAAQGGRLPVAASAGATGEPWLASAIYSAVSAIGRLFERLGGAR